MRLLTGLSRQGSMRVRARPQPATSLPPGLRGAAGPQRRAAAARARDGAVGPVPADP